MSVANWFIDKIPMAVFFILMVVIFGILLFLSFLLVKGKKRSTIAGKENNIYYNENAGKSKLEPNFLKRSIGAAFYLGVMISVASFLFILLFIAAAITLTGGGQSDPFAAFLSSNFGDIGVAIFENDARVIALIFGFLFVVLLTAGYILKSRYRVSFMWGIIIFILALGMFIGLNYLINSFFYDGGILELIRYAGDSLESWVWNQFNPQA